MHRLIMLSNTYQQSSQFNAGGGQGRSGQQAGVALQPAPPGRRSHPRLHAAGQRPAESEDGRAGRVSAAAARDVDDRAAAGRRTKIRPKRERRSVYIFVRRNTRYPDVRGFDMPDTHESCPRRNTTITAPQALELLNNDLNAW